MRAEDTPIPRGGGVSKIQVYYDLVHFVLRDPDISKGDGWSRVVKDRLEQSDVGSVFIGVIPKRLPQSMRPNFVGDPYLSCSSIQDRPCMLPCDRPVFPFTGRKQVTVTISRKIVQVVGERLLDVLRQGSFLVFPVFFSRSS